ncbi:hypothetical protein niasHT_014383 [Heterodera trifolii]|uniref:Uncharacterized protein n=1 Tax=Heterodera trifolii TaxID=157864 RepID=A0ABD2LH84_9BILA
MPFLPLSPPPPPADADESRHGIREFGRGERKRKGGWRLTELKQQLSFEWRRWIPSAAHLTLSGENALSPAISVPPPECFSPVPSFRFSPFAGLFILRLVATNAGELVVVDIIKCLWRSEHLEKFSSRQFHIRPLVYENELSDERRREDEDSLHSLLLNVYSCSSSKGNGPTHQQQQRKQSQQHRFSTNGNSLGLPLPVMYRPASVVALDDSVGTPSPV